MEFALNGLHAVEKRRKILRIAKFWDDLNGQMDEVLQAVFRDLVQTLTDCEELLRNLQAHQLKKERSVSAQKDVHSLIERIKVHTRKITLLSEALDLPTRKSDYLPLIQDSLRAEMMRHGIIARFASAANLRRPPSAWLLEDSFDALVWHFSKSTVEHASEIHGQIVQDITQYLSLLKSLWIFESIQENFRIHKFNSTYLWNYLSRELGCLIGGQFLRFQRGELIKPPDELIFQLPDQSYYIWPNGTLGEHGVLAESELYLEEKILEIPLHSLSKSDQLTLSVFRRDPNKFRICTTTQTLSGAIREKWLEVDMRNCGLVPTYAIPGLYDPNHRIGLFDNLGKVITYLEPENLVYILKLQQALTGYRVNHYASHISWSFNAATKEGELGEGNVQLWQARTLEELSRGNDPTSLALRSESPPMEQEDPFLHSPSLSSSPSVFSKVSTLIASTRNEAFSGTTLGSRGSDTDIIAVEKPREPVLLIFTACQGKFTFLHVERKLPSSISSFPSYKL